MVAEVGQPAPDFTVAAHTGENVTLSSFKGKKHVVLSFHVSSFTGGWAHQCSSFRQENKRFEELGAQVLGLSTDSVHVQKAFAGSFGGLPYPMLTDFHPKGKIAQEYGIWNEERGTDRRAVIIIDKEGVIRFKKVYLTGLPDMNEIIQEVQKLS